MADQTEQQVTIYSPDAPFPRRTIPPIVEVRKDWGDDWQLRPDLEWIDAAAATAAEGGDQATIRRRYGRVKDPYEADLATREPINLDRWWVRVRLANDEGLADLFVGRVQAETRTIHASDDYRSGSQLWTVAGPLRLLDKISISRSYWHVPEQLPPHPEMELGWLPPMNDRDQRGDPGGNRADDPQDPDDGIYFYGGDETWNHKQYAEYLLAQFVDESDDSGPAWTLAGEPDLLEELEQVLDFGDSTTAGEALRELIRHDRGLDWLVRYRAKADEEDDDETDGFEVVVFSLMPTDYTFRDVTLAKNPNRVILQVGDEPDIECTLERSQAHDYGRVRVLGQRLVVCCTLWGKNAIVRGGLVDDDTEAQLRAEYESLVPKWTDDLEDLYVDGTGDADHEAYEHDLARENDHLAPVYQLYGAPEFWTMHDGIAAPLLDDDNELDLTWTITRSGFVPSGGGADYQRHTRETLDWLPLYDGFDYAENPATDENPDGHHPDLLAPAAWMFDPYLQKYAAVEDLGFSLSVSRSDWGIAINASPAHILALNHFTAPADYPTLIDPVYDYDDLIATIALRTDQRLAITVEIDDHAASDGTLDILVPDAEWWYLAPDTVLGVKPDEKNAAQLITSGNQIEDPQVLRDDTDRLAEVMVSTIARYHASRNRASITIRGYWPWSALLGQILAGVEDEGDVQEVAAAITSISWTANPPRTLIKTGYAL